MQFIILLLFYFNCWSLIPYSFSSVSSWYLFPRRSETISPEIPPAIQGYRRKFAFPLRKVLLFWTDNRYSFHYPKVLGSPQVRKRQYGCPGWPSTSVSWSLTIKSKKTNNLLLKDGCASHAALPVTSTGAQERPRLFAGLPKLGQPSFGAGLLPEHVLPPTANSTEERGGRCSQRIYSPVGTQEAWVRFWRELDILSPAFCSWGVRMQHFGTTGRGRKAAPSEVLASLATLTPAVADIPKPNCSPSAFFRPRNVLRQPPLQTPAILFR